MNPIFLIILIVAVVLAVVGGFVQAVQFLLWVGIVLAIVAVIGWLLSSINGRRK